MKTTKRTLIIYNTKETTEEEARHLLEILNCDDSTLWDNADYCGVEIIEVPLRVGLGDVVHFITKNTGIEWLWKKINPSCNCTRRKNKWNKIKLW